MKVEQEWKEEHAEAAKTSNKMSVADKEKPRERADKAIIMKELRTKYKTKQTNGKFQGGAGVHLRFGV